MDKTATMNIAYDRVSLLLLYQTLQRNWVTIKMLYKYLQGCLLSWHGSRLGFITPYDEEVSQGPLSNTTS